MKSDRMKNVTDPQGVEQRGARWGDREEESEEMKEREEEGVDRAGNSLICSSLILSDRSNQMSDCERFARIAGDK